jgi:hypothetical protein
LASDEAFPLERVEGLARLSGPVAQGALPEHFADDRGIPKQLLLPRLQPVETGGDDPLQRLGEGEPFRRTALDEELGELLGVERVPACSLEEGLL